MATDNDDNQRVKDAADDAAAKSRRRLVRVWTWVGAILLAGVGVYLSGILANAIGVIVWTVVFVFILRGPVNWLDEHGVNRMTGTVIAYVLLVAVLFLLLFIVFSPFFGINAQFEDLAKAFLPISRRSRAGQTTCIPNMPTCCKTTAFASGFRKPRRRSAVSCSRLPR